jgi:DNA-binding transcriptional LysR family regulator
MTMLDLVHLRSFVAVHQVHSFTQAAQRLGLGQSTISQHIGRLEQELGRKLFERDTHQLALTADGETLLGHAINMLDIASQVGALFADGQLRGHLRLGVSEDIATSLLPAVLSDFIKSYPSVDLELTVALSGALYQIFDSGGLDLVVAKRRKDDMRGTLVYREPLIWVGRKDLAIDFDKPLPVITFPAPSVTRSAAIDILNRHGVAWRIVCTCGSLSGLKAAAVAGMGVMVQPKSMIPGGLVELRAMPLPVLDDVEFVLVSRRGADASLVAALSEQISAHLQQARHDEVEA